jgi:hypothetical protein
MPTEYDVSNWIADGHLALPPLSFRLRKVRPQYSDRGYWDYEVEAEWDTLSATFAVACRNLSTPKAFEEALRRCRDTDLPNELLPLVILPYLRPSQLAELEANGVSGVDWCGNGVVIAGVSSGSFAVERPTNSRPNRLSKISIAATLRWSRDLFLIAPDLPASVSCWRRSTRRNIPRGGNGQTLMMTMGTVSKALKQLEGDLIIERGDRIQLLQAEKLLDQLGKNYVAPEGERL